MMPSSTSFFRDNLKKLSIQDLWKIIEESLHDHDIPDKTKMNYEQVLELCAMLKETDEMFRELAQITILKRESDKLSDQSSH